MPKKKTSQLVKGQKREQQAQLEIRKVSKLCSKTNVVILEKNKNKGDTTLFTLKRERINSIRKKKKNRNPFIMSIKKVKWEKNH